MAQGTVKFYNSQKGFGFISPDDGGPDVFVHATALERAGLSALAEGTTVTYVLGQGRDGRSSVMNLALAGGPHGSGGGPDD